VKKKFREEGRFIGLSKGWLSETSLHETTPPQSSLEFESEGSARDQNDDPNLPSPHSPFASGRNAMKRARVVALCSSFVHSHHANQTKPLVSSSSRKIVVNKANNAFQRSCHSKRQTDRERVVICWMSAVCPVYVSK
jgi:hypothetical protein